MTNYPERQDDLRVLITAPIDEVMQLRAENERLRAALQEYLRDFGDNEDSDSQRMAAKAHAALAPALPQDSGRLSRMRNSQGTSLWRLVPVEPTREMLGSGWKHVTVSLTAGQEHKLVELWRAMVAAAPIPPQDSGNRRER